MSVEERREKSLDFAIRIAAIAQPNRAFEYLAKNVMLVADSIETFIERGVIDITLNSSESQT